MQCSHLLYTVKWEPASMEKTCWVPARVPAFPHNALIAEPVMRVRTAVFDTDPPRTFLFSECCSAVPAPNLHFPVPTAQPSTWRPRQRISRACGANIVQRGTSFHFRGFKLRGFRTGRASHFILKSIGRMLNLNMLLRRLACVFLYSHLWCAALLAAMPTRLEALNSKESRLREV